MSKTLKHAKKDQPRTQHDPSGFWSVTDDGFSLECGRCYSVYYSLTVKQHPFIGVIVILLGDLLPSMGVPLPKLLVAHFLDLQIKREKLVN